MLNEIEKRMLELMNQQSLIREHDSWTSIKGYNYKSWRQYQEVRTRVICNAEFKENHNYKSWQYHNWRFDAIREMDQPIKRIGKLRAKATKYDHKGKEPNDRSNAQSNSFFLTLMTMTLLFSSTNGFKILQPNQHITSDFKSGNVALCELTPGSLTHANMNDSNLHKIEVNDWTIINDITKRHIFAIPVTRAQEDMTFDLMEQGIGMSVECFNGFRIFSSYGTLRNKSILITKPEREVMSTYVTSETIPFNITYEFTTPDGIYENTEEITTKKHYLMKHESISKIALLTSVKIFQGEQETQDLTLMTNTITFEHELISWKWEIKTPILPLKRRIPKFGFTFKINQHPPKHSTHPHEPNAIDHGKNILLCDKRPSETEAIKQTKYQQYRQYHYIGSKGYVQLRLISQIDRFHRPFSTSSRIPSPILDPADLTRKENRGIILTDISEHPTKPFKEYTKIHAYSYDHHTKQWYTKLNGGITNSFMRIATRDPTNKLNARLYQSIPKDKGIIYTNEPNPVEQIQVK